MVWKSPSTTPCSWEIWGGPSGAAVCSSSVADREYTWSPDALPSPLAARTANAKVTGPESASGAVQSNRNSAVDPFCGLE